MKNLLWITTVLMLVTSALPGQNALHLFNSLEPDVLLKSLFNTPTVLTDKYGTKKAKWKPDPLESWSLPVNDKGWCYTAIDTVIHFEDNGRLQRALVVFTSTGKLQASDDNFPVLGVAEFSLHAPGWIISSVNIGLAERYQGGARLAKFGKDKFALEVRGGDMEQGYQVGWVTYYETDRFDKIFTLKTNEDNEGAVGKDGAGYFGYNVEIKFIESAENYYKIEAKSRGTKQREDFKGIISADSIRTYNFVEWAGIYLETDK